MTDYTVVAGHTLTYSIEFDDTSGAPMLITPVPDAPPAWSNAPNPAGVDTMTVSADGLSDVVVTAAQGSDTVTVSLSVGGTAFTATSAITINPVPQTLGSIKLNAVVT